MSDRIVHEWGKCWSHGNNHKARLWSNGTIEVLHHSDAKWHHYETGPATAEFARLAEQLNKKDKRIERLEKALSPFAAFRPHKHWMFYSLHRKPDCATQDLEPTKRNMQWGATLSDKQAETLNEALAELEEEK